MDGATVGAGRRSAMEPVCRNAGASPRLLRLLLGDAALGRFLVQEVESANAGCLALAGFCRAVPVYGPMNLPK